MNDDLLVHLKNEITDAATPSLTQTVHQNAPNSTNVGVVGHLNLQPTYITINSVAGRRTVVLDTNFCNIFVIMGESFPFPSGSFHISRKRCSNPNLSEKNKEEVLTYPSLFMDRSFDYRKCVNPFQEFYYGLVTDVKEQGKAYRVIYEILPTMKPLYKQLLNDASIVLGINTNNGADVLDATCWLIKRMNLLAELSKAGFDYS